MKKVFISTYGCSNNKAESQIMAGLLEKSGYLIVNEEKNADIVVMNTCSVKNKTENKIIHKLESLEKSSKKVIVAGCLPEADLLRVKNATKSASIVGTNHIQKISQAADSLFDGEIVEFVGKSKEEKVGLPKIRQGIVDIIPISSGCASVCTFCSTKLAKGNLFSYKVDHIVEEVKQSKIGSGAKEFWLTSQDCGCYGFEAKTDIANLLRAVTTEVSGEYFIRLGMANPQHVKKITKSLIESFKDEHIFKFLHIPVQSGSNNILKKMIRGHSVEDYYYVVDEFRKAIPEITIWTDIIVGFPGETDEDFQKSVDLVKISKPDVANISAFSARRGTNAAKMKQLATEIVKSRTEIISKEAKKVYMEQNKRWLGWQGKIMIDEFKESKDNFIGRNYAYKPVAIKGNFEPGQIIDVKIIEASSMCLFGEEIS